MVKPFAVIDCETDPFKYGRTDIKPFIWGYYDGVNYESFAKTEDLLRFIKDIPITCYGHNAGKFDFLFMLNFIEPFSDLLIINGRIAKFNYGACDLRDSYLILPMPLSGYKKDAFEYWKMERKVRHLYRKEIHNYLKNDCLYLWELINEFVQRYGKKITLPSAALAQWKKIEKVSAPNTTKLFHDTIKPFYFGGRCQDFYRGEIKKDFKCIDINSAYPYAMTFNHPIGGIHVQRKIKQQNSLQLCKFTDQNFYSFEGISGGSLPFKEMDGSLTFPHDKTVRPYRCSGWEIRTAIETETVEFKSDVTEMAFPETLNFRKYVGLFWQQKLNSEKGSPEYIFAKLMLNSLYGKFGSNPDNYYSYTTVPIENVEWFERELDYIFVNELDRCAIMKRKLEENEKRFYNVATAASITGFVRAFLFRAINKIRNRGGQVFYCDTDSIIANSGFKDINFSTDLGAWEVEGLFNYGAIAGKKLYAFKDKKGEWKTASKGVQISAKQIVKIAKDKKAFVNYTKESPVFSLKKSPYILKRRISQV